MIVENENLISLKLKFYALKMQNKKWKSLKNLNYNG